MKKFLFVASFAAVSALLFSGCSKDDDGVKSSTHTVQYQLEGSSNVELTSVVYSNASGDATSNTGLSGHTWTSAEFTINTKDVPAVVLTAGEATTDGQSGTLVARIIVDGKVVKENEGTGPIVQASVSYSFY